jgi:hypothetical protein
MRDADGFRAAGSGEVTAESPLGSGGSGVPARRPWYETPRFRRIAELVLALVVAVEGVVAIFLRSNDWEGHRQVGILARTQGLAATPWPWYSLGRVAFDAALSLLPRLAGRALCYLLAVVALGACLYLWDRMVAREAPAEKPTVFAATVATLFATFTVWQRDLDDCGLHLFLLFFLTAAGWLLVRGRQVLAGFWLAVAIVYKTSPLLFLPFLLWKRQWRTAGWTVAFTVLLSILPALWFGGRATLEYHRRTLDTMLRSAAVSDPAHNLIQDRPNLQNQALGPALARYLETREPGDPLYLDHPLFRQFGHLTAERTRRLVTGATVLLVVLLAWRTRRPVATSGEWAVEWSAVTILPVLLAPVCWKQHLVVMLPAVFLVVREQILKRGRPVLRSVVLWLIALLGLCSAPDGPLGRDLAGLLGSYKTFTLAALLALVSVLTLHYRRPGSATDQAVATGR